MRGHRWWGAIAILLVATEAQASFHFMQIEQAIGGVDGDTTQQAIQLRMRSDFQNQTQLSRLRVHDASGANPVLLIDIDAQVQNNTGGSRVLLATTEFAAARGITPDFLLTAPIPPSYLAAGRLTFESNVGTVYWSLAWGGNAYTGSNSGATENDLDGDYGPPTAGALPSTSTQALVFTGAFSALSSTNLADYIVTPAAALFTNNAGQSVSVMPDPTIFIDGFEGPP